jgi:hypothetical protein
VHRGDKAAGAPAPAGVAVKVRWNACHAVALVMPLAHRVVATHGEGALRLDDRSEEWLATLTVPGAGEPAEGSSGGDAIALHPGGGKAFLQNSPPRPKVRKDTSSGTATVFAGVDHVSTAWSPFAPKPARGTPGGNGNNAGVTPTPPAGTVGAAVPASAGAVHEALGPRVTAAGTPASAAAAAVTELLDPTQPTAVIGATWVPPTLAALQAALAASTNFKVRIAAAQALATVPSRLSYRIPADEGAAAGSVLSPAPAAGSPDGPARDAFGATAAAGAPDTPPHMAPALQRPGFDAYPSAFASLLTALEGSDASSDFTEFRYKDQLKGVIRLALLHTIALAQRSDYGRMKAYLDDKATLLFAWLCAEEALLAPPAASGGTASSSAGGDGTGGASAGGDASATASSPAAPLPFGSLAAQGGVDAPLVRLAFRTLGDLFASRHKTAPRELLKRFQDKGAAAAGQGADAQP